jgi:hypothetical protein
MTQKHEIQYTLARPSRQRSHNAKPAANYSQPLAPQLPRITRLMALAIKLQELLAHDANISTTDLARCGRVSRTRLTQILNPVHLAPDLQERLLFLEPLPEGREVITEKRLRRISGMYVWLEQRRACNAILLGMAASNGPGGTHV